MKARDTAIYNLKSEREKKYRREEEWNKEVYYSQKQTRTRRTLREEAIRRRKEKFIYGVFPFLSEDHVFLGRLVL